MGGPGLHAGRSVDASNRRSAPDLRGHRAAPHRLGAEEASGFDAGRRRSTARKRLTARAALLALKPGHSVAPARQDLLMRWLRPRSVTVLAALVAGGFTDVVLTVPSVQFAYRSIAVHAMLEVTASLIAFVTTVLLWGRLKWRRGLDDLLLFAAVGLLAVTSLLFAVVPAAIWKDPHPFSTWTTLVASGLSAALLAVAALVRHVRLRNYEHAARVAVVGMALSLIVIGAVVGASVDRLPIGLDPARSPLNVPGPISGN